MSGHAVVGRKTLTWGWMLTEDSLLPNSPQFAVIDTETTGLGTSDRVVEFACAVVRYDGSLVKRLDTLIDPRRPLGGTSLHGVTDEMAQQAPTFGAVARTLFHWVQGRVLVAHNLAFDWLMIRREFGRWGVGLPIVSGGLCTLKLTRLALGRGASLADACGNFDIPLPVQHRATADVEGTLALLLALRARLGVLPAHRPLVAGCRLHALPTPGQTLPRAQAATSSTRSLASER